MVFRLSQRGGEDRERKSGIDRDTCARKICRSCRGNRRKLEGGEEGEGLLLTSKGLTKGRGLGLLTSRF